VKRAPTSSPSAKPAPLTADDDARSTFQKLKLKRSPPEIPLATKPTKRARTTAAATSTMGIKREKEDPNARYIDRPDAKRVAEDAQLDEELDADAVLQDLSRGLGVATTAIPPKKATASSKKAAAPSKQAAAPSKEPAAPTKNVKQEQTSPPGRWNHRELPRGMTEESETGALQPVAKRVSVAELGPGSSTGGGREKKRRKVEVKAEVTTERVVSETVVQPDPAAKWSTYRDVSRGTAEESGESSGSKRGRYEVEKERRQLFPIMEQEEDLSFLIMDRVLQGQALRRQQRQEQEQQEQQEQEQEQEQEQDFEEEEDEEEEEEEEGDVGQEEGPKGWGFKSLFGK
jgi:hypothetical protein